MQELVRLIEQQLLPNLSLNSPDPKDPVVVSHVPSPWILLGSGNYAAVLSHPDWSNYAIKVYAPGKHGILEEAQVYHKLGDHPSYSKCFYQGANYLLLKRMTGETFYNSLKKGLLIPEQAVQDIDVALAYARGRGLFPHDIHAKNIMVDHGRGVVLDVSDFLKEQECTMWQDVKKAYYRFYVPFAARKVVPVPEFLLNSVRIGYRIFRSN